MKPKTMILMVVAVTCGLGASYMTSRLLAERGEAPETPKVKVLVAKKNLNIGDTLKNPQELFEEKVFTEGEEPRGAIREFEGLKSRIMARSLRTGDHITSEDIFDPAKGGHLMSVALPEGYRAVGIRVNLPDIAGGFASLPHSRVDIISTVKRGTDKDSYSMVLLENILVLAADQNMSLPDGKALPATVVTVAVTPEDALKLSLAKEQGPLSLLLRKFNDKSKSDVDKVTAEQLTNKTFGKPEEIEIEKPTVVAQVPKEEPKTEPKKIETPIEIIEDTKPVTTTVRYGILKGNQIVYQEFVLDEEGNIIESRGGGRTEAQITQPPPPTPPTTPAPTTPRKPG